MAKFLIKTKGGAEPSGKRKVYFTCHPEDFARYFDKVCADVFATHDCAVYYTEDMSERIDDADKPADLGQMNLFIVPVTWKLLSQPNRAMDDDVAYAKKENITILPLMMETGIDEFYSKPEKFGERQYLNPFSRDTTEISYEEKLKKFLESVLISDEMAQKIREAFDAYIFLSYRKKDRRYANELMKLIHSIPEYRDIAIWYDEFLTPGESFQRNIEKAMRDSKLFALLVTPNILETPNFVMNEEYPAARSAGMPIIPAEMVQTDKAELAAKYENIPSCADPSDEEAFKDLFLDTLKKIAVTENDKDPAHNFLIGLAYLDGIDVEVDRRRGIELITSAAEGGLPEAMKKLYEMYDEGKGVQVNYREAVKWAERIAEYYKEEKGEKHPDTLRTLHNLAYTYGKLGEHRKEAQLEEKVYELRCKILGDEHPSTLTSLSNLAATYSDLGEHRKALELKEKVYASQHKILGDEHPYTLTSLNNLAVTYGELGEHRKALELKEKVYALRCKILGKEHPDTLRTLNNLAYTYGELGEHQKALEIQEKVYALRCKILGEEHPDTLNSLSNLAVTYGKLGELRKEVELEEKVYALRCKILGDEHPHTLTTLNNLAYTYGELGDHHKAIELLEKVYELQCKVLGDEHPRTLTALGNLAATHGDFGDIEKAAALMERSYRLHAKVLGKKHPNTLRSKNYLEEYRKKLSGDTAKPKKQSFFKRLFKK
ncbi:MAG: tetratricopeptide repeat protein [Clostridia bacterium]|nr:tetratricopeptide repeat protein [Clostridia bacterium]